jgi:alanine dehydrogenase
LILKVKEPVPEEFEYFRDGQILFTYLHLAADEALTRFLIGRGVTAVAYETVQLPDGTLPLLTPMSEVAGRMSVQAGAGFLQKNNGGRGILLGGIPGVAPAEAVILGGGNVGLNAAKMADGMGARVTVLDVSKQRLNYLDDIFHGKVTTLISNPYNIAAAVKKADLLIGAVLIPGGKCPVLVTEAMVKTMKPGSVIVDVAIDQGGCVETPDHVSTYENPAYTRHGVVHYAVGNMPGAVPFTSTLALTGMTFPYLKKLTQKNLNEAFTEMKDLYKGVNIYKKKLTNKPVADAFGMEYTELEDLLNP